MSGRLVGKRALITQSELWVGPSIRECFTKDGAEVVADTNVLTDPKVEDHFAAMAATLDIAVVNLATPAPQTRAAEVSDEEWRHVFAHLVDPLPRIFRAVLPVMIRRRSGKIIVIGSASALRGIKRASTYSAARGAQVAYVRSVGTEVANQNVQVNLIAPNFVDHPMYFPPEIQALEAFQQRLKTEVPAGRMGKAAELAAFAAFLASDDAGFFSGQSFPLSGGWAT